MILKKFSSILFLLLAGLLIGGCTRSTGQVSPIRDFPLSKGMTWTYSYSEYQPSQFDPAVLLQARSVVKDTIVDTQTVGRFFIAHVQRSTTLVQADPAWLGPISNGIPEWWYVLDGYKIYESRRPLDVNNIQIESMLLDLDFPLDLGKSWCATAGVQKGGLVANCLDAARVTVEELKSVASTAGRFKNCVQITQWSNDGNILQQFCPGFGFVNFKFDHSGTRFGFEQTLTDFSGGGPKMISTFQLIALVLAVLWLVLVAVRFRRSTLALILGLVILGLFTLVEALLGRLTAADLGLAAPASWLNTLLFALAGLAVMLAYSPLADWIASRFFPKPPDLHAFKAVQRSWVSLAVGVVAAWVLGGFLEELIARGIVLNSIEALLTPALGSVAAAVIAILLAAAGAGVMHAYQGPRAMLIIAQISVLFGILFVVSGHNLWTVLLAHGLYDTIAFIRFARRKSRYSTSAEDQPG